MPRHNTTGVEIPLVEYYNPTSNPPLFVHEDGPVKFSQTVTQLRTIVESQTAVFLDVPPWIKDLMSLYPEEISYDYAKVIGILSRWDDYEKVWDLPLFKRYGNCVTRSRYSITSSQLTTMSQEERKNLLLKLINKLTQPSLQNYNVDDYSLDMRESYVTKQTWMVILYNLDRRIMYRRYDAFRPSVVARMHHPGRNTVEITLDGGTIRFECEDIFDGNPAFKKYAKVFNYSTDVPQTLGVTGVKKLDDQKGNVTSYGVELELNTDARVLDVISAFGEPFALCKQDSSVTGRKAQNYEVVTVPATLKYHRVMWTRFFKNINLEDYDTSLGTNNGMHVHIGRDAFEGSPHVLRFSYWFNNLANRWFVVEMSERDANNIQHYCNFANLHDIKTKGKQFTNCVKIADKGKMFAVNMTKSKTIEVRIFKGVVSYASVLKNLELVDAVLEFTRECSIKECDVKGLMDWLSDRPRSMYRALRLYLEKHISLETIERLGNLCRNVDPSKVVDGELIDLVPREKQLLARGDTKWKSALAMPTSKATASSQQFDNTLLSSRKVV